MFAEYWRGIVSFRKSFKVGWEVVEDMLESSVKDRMKESKGSLRDISTKGKDKKGNLSIFREIKYVRLPHLFSILL